MNPIDKYNQRAKEINSLLCVGLDSELEKLPARFREMPNPQFEFNKWIIAETHEFAAAFKMNIAFYEARGDQGLKELKMTMDHVRAKIPSVFTICDAKRADVGNTNRGYVQEIFDWLGFDAVTVNPYLGSEALQPFLGRQDKVSIVLCKTSNPGSGEFQDKIWQDVAQKFSKYNNCMLVVGATYPEEMKTIRSLVGDMTFLVPGIGPQGGDLKKVMGAGLNSAKLGLIINSSRGIIFAEDPKLAAQKPCAEIRKYL